MTDEQKKLIHALLRLSFERGFNFFGLDQLSEITGIPALEIYNGNQESGHLMAFHPAARGTYAGLLTFSGYDARAGVGVVFETYEMLQHWSDFKRWAV